MNKVFALKQQSEVHANDIELAIEIEPTVNSNKLDLVLFANKRRLDSFRTLWLFNFKYLGVILDGKVGHLFLLRGEEKL